MANDDDDDDDDGNGDARSSAAVPAEPGPAAATDAIGFAWSDLVGALVEEHGTLAAVAWKLVERASGDDVASIERALRRLRTRGRDAGGVWGARLLRTFGVPVAIEARARWMGVYHSPFTDLPIALCKDQLRLWDRPPVSESRARVWLAIGFAGCALRERQFAEAAAMIARARGAVGGDAPVPTAKTAARPARGAVGGDAPVPTAKTAARPSRGAVGGDAPVPTAKTAARPSRAAAGGDAPVPTAKTAARPSRAAAGGDAPVPTAKTAARPSRAAGARPATATIAVEAQLEIALIDAYLASRDGRGAAASDALLSRAEALVGSLAATAAGDRGELACFRARIADHRAYHLNHAGDHAAALALYAALPDDDRHPFASYRRDAGRAYGAWRARDTPTALALARRACDHAGDGGYVRLRAMGLLLIARISGDAAARDRARAIATRLGDVELLARIDRPDE